MSARLGVLIGSLGLTQGCDSSRGEERFIILSNLEAGQDADC